VKLVIAIATITVIVTAIVTATLIQTQRIITAYIIEKYI
jgi:hypothetical protein